MIRLQRAALIDARTKAIYCESIGNPLGNVVDFGAFAEVAHAHGVPLIVDNTVPSPYLTRPIEHWRRTSWCHSLTKYMGGHGTSIGGIIVDSGKFPWGRAQRAFPSPERTGSQLPRRDLHRGARSGGLHRAGRGTVPLRKHGRMHLAPSTASSSCKVWKPWALRMDRHCENALKVAEFLKKHPKASWVNYAGLPDHPSRPLVDKYFGGKASGLLTFGVKGGREAGARFQDALKLVTRLVNIGDAKSLACHPASTTHRQLSAEELKKAGVSEDMVRLSIGIEHIDDILAETSIRALAAA